MQVGVCGWAGSGGEARSTLQAERGFAGGRPFLDPLWGLIIIEAHRPGFPGRRFDCARPGRFAKLSFLRPLGLFSFVVL